MRVEINFRPYQEQKPPKSGWYLVIVKGVYRREKFILGRECSEWPLLDPDGLEVPTHFALPEDITIINDNPKE